MPDRPKTCPDCRRKLAAIQVIDKQEMLGPYKHGVLEYAVADAKRGKWSGNFPVQGRILAYMCEACGRVLLYARPNE